MQRRLPIVAKEMRIKEKMNTHVQIAHGKNVVVGLIYIKRETSHITCFSQLSQNQIQLHPLSITIYD
jgi:hypothetical protein